MVRNVRPIQIFRHFGWRCVGFFPGFLGLVALHSQTHTYLAPPKGMSPEAHHKWPHGPNSMGGPRGKGAPACNVGYGGGGDTCTSKGVQPRTLRVLRDGGGAPLDTKVGAAGAEKA